MAVEIRSDTMASNLWKIYGQFAKAGRPQDADHPTWQQLRWALKKTPGPCEITQTHVIIPRNGQPHFSSEVRRKLGTDLFAFVIDSPFLYATLGESYDDYREGGSSLILGQIDDQQRLISLVPQDFSVIAEGAAWPLNVKYLPRRMITRLTFADFGNSPLRPEQPLAS